MNMWKPSRGGATVGEITVRTKPSDKITDTQLVDNTFHPPAPTGEEVEIQFNGTTSITTPVDSLLPYSPSIMNNGANESEEVAALTEAFDLLGGDFSALADDLGHSDQELLDAMDKKVDPAAAFTIDDEEF